MNRLRLLGAFAVLVLFAGACTSTDDSGSSNEDVEETEDTGETVGSDEAPEEAEYVSDADYSDQSIWLCHPAVDGDACDIDLDATLIAADGTTTVEPFEPLADAPVDCFYLYPTSSTDPGENSDLVPDSEAAMAHNQIARFAEVCNVYAPMYRSIPLGALFDRIEERQAEEDDESGSSEDEGDEEAADSSEPAPAQFAYADVEAAFAHYMAEENDGKPFVLVGHSQGSGMMRTLVSEQIDDEDEVRSQLLSTMMIGASVRSDSEGDPEFANIPPCESPDQTGCVISFATYYEDEPPPESSFFGRRDPEDGARVLCSNPANLAGGSGPLSSYYGAGGTETVAVTTPWVHYEGLLVSECASSEDFDWLQITNTHQEGDARPADVGGRLTPEWGTHLSDVNMTIGNLIELVKTQSGGE